MIKTKLNGVTELLFIPYAGVSLSYDEYTAKVQTALNEIGIKVTGIHECDDPVLAVNNAQAVAVGGGNTFHLLHQLYQNELIESIQHKVSNIQYIYIYIYTRKELPFHKSSIMY